MPAAPFLTSRSRARAGSQLGTSCRVASRSVFVRGVGVLVALVCGLSTTGCSLFPDVRDRPRYHNPLPQLHRIAVLPFFNQSSEPTLDELKVTEAYYAELQAIPGFEVMPVGVTLKAVESYALGTGRVTRGGQVAWEMIDFQELARALQVDAVVVGSVTDYDPYYPPRMAMTTRWFAANPAFHPVPPGYGLPWGTKAEKEIPQRVLLETELAVARAQMATQTPPLQSDALNTGNGGTLGGVVEASGSELVLGSEEMFSGDFSLEAVQVIDGVPCDEEGIPLAELGPPTAPLPADWPDPANLIPAAPDPNGPPPAQPQAEPIMSHTRLYRGDDTDFTEQLADYVYAMDDGRLGGWQGYLTRSDDFIRFCCHLHITEMLEMRGGRDQSDLIIRWPIGRYRR